MRTDHLLWTVLPKPSRETKFSGTNVDREIFIFPVQLTTSRIGNLTRLIHTLAICATIHIRAALPLSLRVAGNIASGFVGQPLSIAVISLTPHNARFLSPIMNAIPSEISWYIPNASLSFGPVPTQSVMEACAMLRESIDEFESAADSR